MRIRSARAMASAVRYHVVTYFPEMTGFSFKGGMKDGMGMARRSPSRLNSSDRRSWKNRTRSMAWMSSTCRSFLFSMST